MIANACKIDATVPANGPGLDTKAELAEFLRLTGRTIENLQKQGLPHYRIGPRRNRYDRQAVLAWLAKGGAR